MKSLGMPLSGGSVVVDALDGGLLPQHQLLQPPRGCRTIYVTSLGNKDKVSEKRKISLESLNAH
jgi:hypothetical protein